MSGRLASQSFLGPESNSVMAAIEVGIAGLGGGGSHVAQQLAHVGVGTFVPVDHDIVEEKNLNRLVGATAEDAKAGAAKTAVAERMIKGVNPAALVTPRRMKWQEAAADLSRLTDFFPFALLSVTMPRAISICRSTISTAWSRARSRAS